MAAAARLRVRGHDVVLLEQASTLGGKLGSRERDGFVFDTGPSLLTIPAVYRDLFAKTGGVLEESVDIVPLDTAFAYHFADGARVDMPGVDPGRCAVALGDGLAGRAADEWRRFMVRAGQMWQITRQPILESPLSGPRDLMALARRPRDIATIAPWSTLRALAHASFTDRRLITLLDRYATYTGSDPRRAPAVLATVPYVEQAFGAWHLRGGLRTLAEALARRCIDLGVQVQTDTEVTAIETADSAVSGVRVSGGATLPADVVVANADAQHVYADLLAHLGRDPRRRGPLARLSRATASLSGFVLLLAVKGRTPGVEHHNVWFPEDYDAEFDAVFGRQAEPVSRPTIYACVPDDDRMRPDADHESWFILINAPRHGAGPGAIDWRRPGLADAYADHVLAVLAERGVDLRPRLLWKEIRTPADLEQRTAAPGGAIYGTSSNGARAAFLRPANRSPVPGLFLVGGSAHPGGGLPLVGMSAEIVAGLVGRA